MESRGGVYPRPKTAIIRLIDYPMKDNLANRRLRWLMLFRVVIVTVLLGIAAFIQFKGTEALPKISLASIYIIILLTYFFSFLYLFLLKIIKSLDLNIYIQSFSDVALITGLVYVTGGIESIYSVFYPLVIIYSVLFLARRGGLIVASVSSILYGLLLDLEYFGLIQPIYFGSWDYDYSAGYVFSRIFIHIVFFYLVALLTSFAVKQEKQARALLAEKESAFDRLDLLHRSIIESVDTGILTIDLQGNIKSFNKGAEEITGFSHSEIINRKIDDFSPGFSEVPDRIRSGDDDSAVGSRFEMVVPKKGGKNLILGCSVSKLLGSEEEKIGKILIFQDLTAIKEMEHQVERNRRLAFIGEMAAGLAHEIRNPLASISGSIQVLERDLDLDETDRRLMQIILRGKDQLESFMKDFLLLARPNSTEREDIDVGVIMENTLESFRYGPDWHESIEIIRDLCNQNDIYGNRSEIRQAVWNLILNAVQSMPEGGRLKIETRPVFNDEKEHLEIRISDSGCGIEEKDIDKVFEPFYTTKEKGTGLGLAIVNRITESHGGSVTIESEPGKGTSCIVLLPRSR
ncbi:MAG: PAS domain S-box protein [Proteobacteria bacterium]|nr:PAS domain S-box protein [Pseudomonadota bacterium]